ncbi:MAG: hypothetical protein LIO69_03760 [Oscillospiraceae bacterium]|nr:hypothetical protein [Oscillospiraceae bacterium]
MEKECIDIHGQGEYPANAISNFAPHSFTLDGVRCGSMEGFLQSLKFKNPEKQHQVCALSGFDAKRSAGKWRNFRWKITGCLYWQGERIERCSDEYYRLIDRAYEELSKDKDFTEALLSTGDKPLIHSVGGHKMKKTVLTEYEYVTRLTLIRKKLKEETTENEG